MPDSSSRDSDNLLVEQFLSSETLANQREAIIAGHGTTEGIEEHYRAYDAIGRLDTFKSPEAAQAYQRYIGRVALADFIGGAQIISSTLMPGLNREKEGYTGILSAALDDAALSMINQRAVQGVNSHDDLDRLHRMAEYAGTTGNLALKVLTERVGLLHCMRLIGCFDDDMQISTTEKLRAVSLGRAIMHEGQAVLRSFAIIEVESGSDADALASIMHVTDELNLFALPELILRSAYVIPEIEAKDIFLKELKNIYSRYLSWPTNDLELLRIQTAQLGTPHPDSLKEHVQNFQRGAFKNAVLSLQLLALFARSTNRDLFKKGRIKGSLHEMIWVLDAFALRKGNPDQFGSYIVGPASEAEDMPFIGNPIMKRGYDFYVQQGSDSQRRRFIQIGSSKHKIKRQDYRPYHPVIEVYGESSFNEVNLRVLDRKLSSYLEWEEGGFTQEDYERLGIDRQLLGSVRECFRPTD